MLKIKNKRTVLFLVAFAVLCFVCMVTDVPMVMETVKKDDKVTIVVDCGHGGIDPGKVGINGAYEKDVNLAIGLFLKEDLEKEKYKVIMTREADCGLYEETDTNKKISDLKRRAEVMNQDEVDFAISIHQNSFSDGNTRGAQVFYYADSESGESFAKTMQEQLKNSLDTKNHRQAKANNEYYLLKNTVKTLIIVECGFLSNQEEAQKLCDESYQRQIAWAIAQGTKQYIEKKP
ncbi:MAG: N-acetylmuramoyl-L-alanine amidase [Butyribacter sp.]|nr:N-acetylmuramoyl-L-alanine amidase [bacterium]MDY3855006.1 N-acetylmuramoyl-L-alanine amidase [Butyribacter sp.]